MLGKKVLTTGEIARFCGVNFRTVLRWITRGELRAYKLPGRGDNRVHVADFLEFLSAHDLPVPESLQPVEYRALVVDDEAYMARAIRRVLRRGGYQVWMAQDGFRAGALLGAYQPAVVTLDLQMPGLKGLDVLQFIRETTALNRVKILVVSGMDALSLAEARSAGADDVLPKPFTPQELLAKVDALTGKVPIPLAMEEFCEEADRAGAEELIPEMANVSPIQVPT